MLNIFSVHHKGTHETTTQAHIFLHCMELNCVTNLHQHFAIFIANALKT